MGILNWTHPKPCNDKSVLAFEVSKTKTKKKLVYSRFMTFIPTFLSERHRLNYRSLAAVNDKLVDWFQKGSLAWNLYCGIHIVIIFHKFGTVKCVYDKKCSLFLYFKEEKSIKTFSWNASYNRYFIGWRREPEDPILQCLTSDV